jgi:hypothetical protein
LVGSREPEVHLGAQVVDPLVGGDLGHRCHG